MAGIKQPILDIKSRLQSIEVDSQEGGITNLFSQIWNNQLDRMVSGDGYAFPRPAAFIEIVNPVTYEVIGLGMRSADLGIRIHLIHDFFNADGTYDEDLKIFDIRDQILAPDNGLSQFCPTGCGTMNCVSEEQDYEHDNVYHYILDFVCNFTDTKGSKFDDGQSYIEENVDLELDVTAEYIIPQIPN